MLPRISMRLTEYDACQLLERIGIAFPEHWFFSFETNEWPRKIPWEDAGYLKAQVLRGRRGKTGLVCRCASLEEAGLALAQMRQGLSSDTCAGFLWVKEQFYRQAWFVSCDIDRVSGFLRFHLGEGGGEYVGKIQTWVLDQPHVLPTALPAEFLSISRALVEAMRRFDALSIEINPLVVTVDGELIALDAKIELDDAASFRHPEWRTLSFLSRWGEVRASRERAYIDLCQQDQEKTVSLGRYVELDGDVAMILSGGGASLVALDALKQAGGHPANYLEVAGNPDPIWLKRVTSIVLSHPRIRAVWIAGSYANFTDVQKNLRAILEAYEESKLRVPIFIRRDGPLVEQARQEAMVWARKHNQFLEFHRANISFLESARSLVRKM